MGKVMNLSSKQFILLALPFMIAIIVYSFNKEMLSYTHYFFPTYEVYENAELDKQTNIYFELEQKRQEYQEIEKKEENRRKNTHCVANLLYKEKRNEIKNTYIDKKVNEEPKEPYTFNLQAIFDDSTVIINNIVLKKGNSLNNAVIEKIEDDRVLIKTKEGSTWLFLFK